MTLTLDAVVESPGRIFFDSLRRRLTGSLLTHDDAGYDELVSPWNLAVPMRPAAVVAARTDTRKVFPAGVHARLSAIRQAVDPGDLFLAQHEPSAT